MWSSINILVLVLLYLQCINCKELLEEKQIFVYKGKILMKNVASDKLASMWTISGLLSVEHLNDNVTLKLDNVKTRIFNGDPKNVLSVSEKNIPDNSKIIQEPFVLYLGTGTEFKITHKPHEPIWSLNMKRAIANNFLFFSNASILTESVMNETTIYGVCEVHTKISRNKEIQTIEKTINHKSCTLPNHFYSNVFLDPTSKDFDPIKSETNRTYYFKFNRTGGGLIKIHSKSLTTYQSMPGVRSKQIIEQSQEFTQIHYTNTFKPLNIVELTKASSIVYDFSDEMNSKNENNINSNELIKNFARNYEELKKYFEKYPLLNTNFDVHKYLVNMYNALKKMDKDTLLRLEKTIMKNADSLFKHLFASYLPYIGTNESLNYIKDLVAQDKVLNDLLTIRILATLPAYVSNASEEIVQEMEDLMDLKKVANDQVKYAGILSFASIVSTANAQDVLNLNSLNKYVGIYNKNFKDAKNYETKMVWLLGLINMANTLNSKDIVALITNTGESRHIRVLAAYGFKHYIVASSEMYTNMWPIVQNNSEPFEVRVACLDLLFYSQISKEQFQNIINWYKDKLQEPSEHHLANYVYTSLNSLQNTTGYFEYLGDYATETLQQIKHRKLSKAWTTGNYRIAYTDSDANFGASYQTRFISNPVTNMVNSVFLTVDSFAHSLNLGRYSVYIKAEGIADFFFSLLVINREEDFTVPKLLELIQKNAYKFKPTANIHIDVVIFCQNRVVFSMHINKHNIVQFYDNQLFIEILSLIGEYNSLSFPVVNYNYCVSDLGTPLKISTEIVDAASYKLQGFNQLFNDDSFSSLKKVDFAKCTLNYRSVWYYNLYTESYNPLIDASIATFKHNRLEKRIHIPFGLNFTSKLLQWKHEPDAFNILGDHLIGTMVDKEKVLREYCRNCQHISLVNKDTWDNYEKGPLNILYQIIGVTLNVSWTKISADQMILHLMEPIRTDLLEIIDHHQAITFDNLAKPLLLLNHYMTYLRYIYFDLCRYSIRSFPYYYRNPSETIIQLVYNMNDNSNANNPIAKNDMNISISLTTRKQHSKEILSHGNLTFKYFSASDSNNSDVQPQIHHKYNVELTMYSDTESPRKFFIKRDVQYPKRRINKFSLEPVDIAKAYTSFIMAKKYRSSAYFTSDEYHLMEVYSSTNKQKAIMLASNNYKNCKKQSKDLKYTPPTDDCFASHEIISKYERCDIYTSHSNPFPIDNSIPRIVPPGIIRFLQLNDTHTKITEVDYQLHESELKYSDRLQKFIDKLDFTPLITINPRVIAYDDDELEWGIASACYITSDTIRTFTRHTIKKYNEKFITDPVAFVECFNTTTTGMTIQKYGDKYVGFHLYSYNDSLTVSVPNADGKLKIQSNEIITRTKNPKKLKLNFLDDNVIFITLDVADIFYTGEYISIKINSVYNNFICGLCAETKNH